MLSAGNRHSLIAACVLAIFTSQSAYAVKIALNKISGQLVGDLSEWGDVDLIALKSRDFSEPHLAIKPLKDSGQFSFEFESDIAEVYLALLPKQGALYPLLLQESPVAVPSAEIKIAVRGPPMERQQRQQSQSPMDFRFSLGLLMFVGFVIWLVRRRPDGEQLNQWVPTLKSVGAGHLGIIGITAACAGLMSYGIFILDEAMDLLEYTYFQEAYSGTDPISVALSPVVAERAHAPGYAVLLWALTSISNSEIWLRLPAMLAALLGCIVVYRLVSQATGDKRVAQLSALLTTLAPLTLRYARDVTPYSVVGLLSVTATWLFYRALCTNSKRDWAFYAATGATAFFFHYFVVFVFLGHFIALCWLCIRGRQQAHWNQRLRRGFTSFAAMSILPVLWAPQVIRALVISEQDNIVTRAVYLESTGFFSYLMEHFRVLLCIPAELPRATWPLFGVLILSYWVLLKDHPVLGRILLVPSGLLLALLALVYWLHMSAFGGRVYFGWRWLRPYTVMVAIPIAYLAFKTVKRSWRLVTVTGTVTILACTLWTGFQSATERQRPAQRTAATTIIDQARDGDVVAVLPAAFYSVGFSYYLNRGAPKSIHPGPSQWDYFPKDDDFVRLYGPLRSFGIPLESIAGHIDVPRLWIAVFRESIFGQPEFDPDLAAHVLNSLDTTMIRKNRWRMPFLDVVLYERKPLSPWTQGGIKVTMNKLYQSLKWIPASLDPDPFSELVRGTRPLQFRFPTPVGDRPVNVRITGAPENAKANDIMTDDLGLVFQDGQWSGRIKPKRSDYFNITLVRNKRARTWPLTMELK